MGLILILFALAIISPFVVRSAKKIAQTSSGAGAGLAIGLIFAVLFDPPKAPSVEWRKERQAGEADDHCGTHNEPEK